jgi:hypothetical protein
MENDVSLNPGHHHLVAMAIFCPIIFPRLAGDSSHYERLSRHSKTRKAVQTEGSIRLCA